MKNASFERSLGDVERCGKPRPLLRRRIKAVAAVSAADMGTLFGDGLGGGGILLQNGGW
jgi:hypothetical protein